MIGETKYVKSGSTAPPAVNSASVVHAKYQSIKPVMGYAAPPSACASSISKEMDSNFHRLANMNNNGDNNNNSGHTDTNGNTNVKFIGFFENKIDEREKYLTAKYPNHQMALIKKRLKVEFWIDEQLKHLFNIKDENKEDYDICADDLVDNLLDMDTDHERKFHILNQLRGAKRNREDVMVNKRHI
jgi:protein phosphatase 1 regulatory subunit 14B